MFRVTVQKGVFRTDNTEHTDCFNLQHNLAIEWLNTDNSVVDRVQPWARRKEQPWGREDKREVHSLRQWCDVCVCVGGHVSSKEVCPLQATLKSWVSSTVQCVKLACNHPSYPVIWKWENSTPSDQRQGWGSEQVFPMAFSLIFHTSLSLSLSLTVGCLLCVSLWLQDIIGVSYSHSPLTTEVIVARVVSEPRVGYWELKYRHKETHKDTHLPGHQSASVSHFPTTAWYHLISFSLCVQFSHQDSAGLSTKN